MLLKRIHLYVTICVLSIFLSGCGDSAQDKVDRLKPIIEKNFQILDDKIKSKTLRNVQILDQYARQAQEIEPELSDLINILAVDATIENPNLKTFKERFKNLDSLQTSKEKAIELMALQNATTPDIYNETLLDTINVLAGLTGGKLPAFDSDSKQTSQTAGTYLVGNPSYGHWGSSGGSSIWTWYAGYRMFGVLSGNQHYYHRWYHNRPWSYYHDHGRSMYGGTRTNQQYTQMRTQNDRAIKQYGQRTGRHSSAYAKKTNTRFTPSSVTKRTQSSSYVASQRRGSSRSRGSFGGK
ncbi:MAG: hypothetical protein ACJARD_001682 [Alphaproteobacteria bacterium]|jgi:hypothetical protein